MAAQYADEAKRKRSERGWLIAQITFWTLMALGAAGIAVVGYFVIRSAPENVDMGIVLALAGLMGLAVAGTLAVASVVETVQWTKSNQAQ